MDTTNHLSSDSNVTTPSPVAPDGIGIGVPGEVYGYLMGIKGQFKGQIVYYDDDDGRRLIIYPGAFVGGGYHVCNKGNFRTPTYEEVKAHTDTGRGLYPDIRKSLTDRMRDCISFLRSGGLNIQSEALTPEVPAGSLIPFLEVTTASLKATYAFQQNTVVMTSVTNHQSLSSLAEEMETLDHIRTAAQEEYEDVLALHNILDLKAGALPRRGWLP